ncbi:NAD-binding domain and a Fe-S cluster-containing protein [Stigmatella aurantiaca]|uniref:NAD-binding domain and a Fe-S cluster-containing protein n=1 Tax=Stigmatella aurantiaca TaxID=41 RepID=A0A1H7IZY5_STIAU|nr:FAD-dependent oxidoreductase [Stigmatella aurantiaca]SEK67968.1 NAD-binding domain and a Fe-S cluster-containing protein [Stigmatella aurantiaca]
MSDRVGQTGRQGRKRRIVILGGGVGAMTAAYGLTSAPGWKDQYEVVLYTLGWRLGGKGASGRNADVAQRIEEHGLHVWMGHYENAFRMMRQVYAELGRRRGAPLATLEEAFKKQSLITLFERTPQGWVDWNFHFPTNAKEPGQGEGMEPHSLADALDRGLQLLVDQLRGAPGAGLAAATPPPESLPAQVEGVMRSLGLPLLPRLGAPGIGRTLQLAQQLAARLPRGQGAQDSNHLQAILWLIEEAWGRLSARVVRQWEDSAVRKLWSVLELGLVIARGILRDRVLETGFNGIDGEDFRAWLARHGASDFTLYRAPLVPGMYALLFAYVKGDPAHQSLAAGVATRFLLRMGITYKGAIFYKMRAGMGDVVFAPLYEVLKRRGVEFHFFHKVDQLRVNSLTRNIDRVEMTRQVTLKDPAAGYQPLVDVLGLPCWPDRPRYEQLVEGEQLQASRINLESAWAPRGKSEQYLTLERGRDYDLLVMGISLGAFPHVAGELMEHSPRWQRMVEALQTNQTMGVQLWLSRSLEGLGWQEEPTVSTTYAEPVNTYADMSQLLPREPWPAGTVRNLAYFTAPFTDAPEIPPFTDTDFPRREHARLKEIALRWFREWTGALWPHATGYNPTALNWELLVDLDGARRGVDRFDSQFWKANIDPSERYVLSLPGSTEARLGSHDSGYNGLYLAGDWTLTGLNCGCVEAAVMSGLQAAQAISGTPAHISGESDF